MSALYPGHRLSEMDAREGEEKQRDERLTERGSVVLASPTAAASTVTRVSAVPASMRAGSPTGSMIKPKPGV